MDTITWNDFEKVELRVGKIIEAEIFKEAKKPAYKLLIDFGHDIGTKKQAVK
jgi:tRNA-binding protein